MLLVGEVSHALELGLLFALTTSQPTSFDSRYGFIRATSAIYTAPRQLSSSIALDHREAALSGEAPTG